MRASPRHDGASSRFFFAHLAGLRPPAFPVPVPRLVRGFASGLRLMMHPSFITQNGVRVVLANLKARSDARRNADEMPAIHGSAVVDFLLMCQFPYQSGGAVSWSHRRTPTGLLSYSIPTGGCADQHRTVAVLHLPPHCARLEPPGF
jgi:hypothetical protein